MLAYTSMVWRFMKTGFILYSHQTILTRMAYYYFVSSSSCAIIVLLYHKPPAVFTDISHRLTL
jgi:hypothetical protein